MRSSYLAAAVLISLCIATMASSAGAAGIEVVGGRCRIVFDPNNGSILSIGEVAKQGAAGERNPAILHGGEQGLWHARFADGSELDSASFAANSADRRASVAQDPAGLVHLDFKSAEISVAIAAAARPEGVEFSGRIAPGAKTVLEFSIPARLRFEPNDVTRFISPVHPHIGVGMSFHGEFFAAQSPQNPSSWQVERPGGPQAYQSIFKGGLDMRDLKGTPVKLSVTDEGQKWLGQRLAQRMGNMQAVVSRPSKRNQVDLVLVDSPDGPFVAASRLGGKGCLWRLGGTVGDNEAGFVADTIITVIENLAARSAGRKKVGLLSMTNGPAGGGEGRIPVREWQERLQRLEARSKGKVQAVELVSPQDVSAAAGSEEFLAILNPYGEDLPVGPSATLLDAVQEIARYVRQGGNWIETGGYSFYYAIRPAKYLTYEHPYPPVFADFFHVDAVGGSVSIYRVQPRIWQPWQGAKDANDIFIPGRLAFGGDASGGYCQRPYGTYVKAGREWRFPTVRVAAGSPAADDLRAYAAANGITRTLKDKLPAALLEKFRQAVLVKYSGNNQELIDGLPKMPVPSLLHVTDYLKGGFDREYPDHLPPPATYGTPRQFRELFDKAHQLGHLMMPYTNPTWWCDHPRGPTFIREGEVPLLRNLEGKTNYERYGARDGWTICMWHPAVRAANDKTLREFTDEYPVDVLFQDQCGARTWAYDTNPASPTPYAFAEGFISLVEEQCRTKPLGTEDGWDRVVNAEVQLCGMTFALIPTSRIRGASPVAKGIYAPRLWEIYPVAQIIAHDKTAMLQHDLGGFVTDRTSLSWTLGLGFGMSYWAHPRLIKPEGLEWLRWIDRIQKSVCARYTGEPVVSFEHDRGLAAPAGGKAASRPASFGQSGDGVIRATYGPVKLAANLDPMARQEGDHALPAWGFFACAPGMTAGNLRSLGGMDFGEEGISFVAEGDAKAAQIWIYGKGGTDAAVELPAEISGPVSVTFDGQAAADAKVAGRIVMFRLPAGENLFWHAAIAKR